MASEQSRSRSRPRSPSISRTSLRQRSSSRASVLVASPTSSRSNSIVRSDTWRDRLMMHLKPNQRAHMHQRLNDIPSSDPTTLTDDSGVLLELWRMRVNGETVTQDGEFATEEKQEAYDRVHGKTPQGRTFTVGGVNGVAETGEAVGGSIPGEGVEVNGSLRGESSGHGPLGERSAHPGSSASAQPLSRGSTVALDELRGVGAWVTSELEHEAGKLEIEDVDDEAAEEGAGQEHV